MATRRNVKKTRSSFNRRRVCKVARVWSGEEVSFLRKHYRNHDTTWCAKQLGRTVYSVRYKACDLSIRKGSPSTWKNPGKKVTFFAKTKPTTRRAKVTTRKKTTTRGKKTRWASTTRKTTRRVTRKNNRRSKW